jgi:hypothetical protein
VTGTGAESSTAVHESAFTVGPFAPSPFIVGMRVPECWHSVADKRDGMRPVWFYGLRARPSGSAPSGSAPSGSVRPASPADSHASNCRSRRRRGA